MLIDLKKRLRNNLGGSSLRRLRRIRRRHQATVNSQRTINHLSLQSLEDRRLLVATISVTAEAPVEIDEDSRARIVYSMTRDETDGFLAVKLELSGDAVYQQDYTADEKERDTIRLPELPPAEGPVTATATFFPGEETVELIVNPIEDALIETDEDIVVTVVSTDEFGSVTGAAAKIVEDEPTEYYVVDFANRLATVDIETGDIDLIGSIPAAQVITDIAFTEDGDLFAISSDHLFQVDVTDIDEGSISTTFLGFHGIANATSLIDSRDGDFGSESGDLFAIGQNFLDLQWIDLEKVSGQVVLNNVLPVFDIDGTLASMLLNSDYVATGDLDYETGGDLILAARRPSEDFDSLIEIKTPGTNGVIENAPKPAEDPGEVFAGIFGLAFDGNDSFGFMGNSMLRINQFSRDSARDLEMTGRPYEIDAVNSATGTITGDPADPPVVTVNGFQSDPPDLSWGEQPTSWQTQRSEIVEIVVQLGAPVVVLPLEQITLTNLGRTGTEVPDEVLIDGSNVVFEPGSDVFTLIFDQGQLDDGRYELRLGSDITSGPEFTFSGDRDNRFYVLRADWDGNAIVDLRDVETFAYWFGFRDAHRTAVRRFEPIRNRRFR